MKNFIKTLFIMLSLLPLFISARECTWAETSSEKKLASNIKWTIEYHLKNNKMYFDVTVSNVFGNLYIKDLKNGKTYKKSEFVINDYTDNQKISFEVYTKLCNEVVMTKNITLPAYNKYYTHVYCSGISEYSLCRKWGLLSSSITEKELKIQTDEYREQKSLKQELEPKRYETKISGFYAFSALAIIILLMILVFMHRTKRKKDFI